MRGAVGAHRPPGPARRGGRNRGIGGPINPGTRHLSPRGASMSTSLPGSCCPVDHLLQVERPPARPAGRRSGRRVRDRSLLAPGGVLLRGSKCSFDPPRLRRPSKVAEVYGVSASPREVDVRGRDFSWAFACAADRVRRTPAVGHARGLGEQRAPSRTEIEDASSGSTPIWSGSPTRACGLWALLEGQGEVAVYLAAR